MTKLKDIPDFFNSGERTINNLKAEIKGNNTFKDADLQRIVVQIANVNVVKDDKKDSTKKAARFKKRQSDIDNNRKGPGTTFSKNLFVHFDNGRKNLFVFEDSSADLTMKVETENATGKVQTFFAPSRLGDAYNNNIIVTYTDDHDV